jgi:hypothetical protein
VIAQSWSDRLSQFHMVSKMLSAWKFQFRLRLSGMKNWTRHVFSKKIGLRGSILYFSVIFGWFTRANDAGAANTTASQMLKLPKLKPYRRCSYRLTATTRARDYILESYHDWRHFGQQSTGHHAKFIALRCYFFTTTRHWLVRRLIIDRLRGELRRVILTAFAVLATCRRQHMLMHMIIWWPFMTIIIEIINRTPDEHFFIPTRAAVPDDEAPGLMSQPR